MDNPECLESNIEEDIAGLFKVGLALLLLAAIMLLPSKSTGILQSPVVLFNGFFLFPFIALHEVGHVVIFFIFYDPENIVIVLERDPPWGYVPASDYAKGFPKSLITLGGLFVDFFFLSLFAVYLLRRKGYQLTISGIKGKYIPRYSSGEIYAAYGVMLNLYHFLGSLIPFAYDAKGDEFHNDFFLFWELNGFIPPDFSHRGLAPELLSCILKLPALFFACLFIIYIFSPVIANTRELYERKYSLFRAGKKESKGKKERGRRKTLRENSLFPKGIFYSSRSWQSVPPTAEPPAQLLVWQVLTVRICPPLLCSPLWTKGHLIH